MMPDFDNDADLRAELDEELCHRLAAAADMQKSGYEEWIQRSIVDLLQKAEFLLPTAHGAVREQIQAHIDDLKDIDNRKLKAAKKAMKDAIAEVRQINVLDGPAESLDALRTGADRFEQLVHQVTTIRAALLAHWDEANGDQ